MKNNQLISMQKTHSKQIIADNIKNLGHLRAIKNRYMLLILRDLVISLFKKNT